MLDKEILNQYRNDAQGLARYFSEEYFKEHEKVFPINPFQVLTDLGIHFVFRNFDKMEGLFMPFTADMPIDLVAINAKRPITRQRFSAAHELCHFLKDADTQSTFMCAISSNEYKEKYAESFAASFLMPEDELRVQIDSLHPGDGELTFDDVLKIYDSKATYEKLFDWTDEHKFKTGKYSYKEAVIDELATASPSEYLTKISIQVF